MADHDPFCFDPVDWCICDRLRAARADEQDTKFAQLDHAEAVAARLVEVICEQDDLIQIVGVDATNHRAAAADMRRERDAARADGLFAVKRWQEAVDAREQMRAERDAARAEVAALRDEYVIVCDGDPKMDGSHERHVLGRFATLEQVKAQIPGVIARSKWAPKSNLRIEHRQVSEWTVVEEFGDV